MTKEQAGEELEALRRALQEAKERLATSGLAEARRRGIAADTISSDRLWRLALDAHSAPVAILDQTGTILAVNQAWRRSGAQFGLAWESDAVGSSYLALCDSSHGADSGEGPVVAQAIRDLIAGRRDAFHLEYPCSATGEQRWFVVHATRFESDGKPHAVVTHQEITARQRGENALQASNLQLRASNEERRAYAHNVAHDLKSPLSVALGHAQLLLVDYATLSDKERKNSLREIVAAGNRMLRIIDGLLLLAEVQLSELVPVRVEMAPVVAEAKAQLRPLIDDHQAEITLPSRWPAVLGYAPWLEQVWANLLSNAVHYGGRPPRIELGSAKEPAGMARFWVRDNGPGISAEQQALLFEPYGRTDRGGTGGHGLGLSIVRRVVEKLGGQVRVDSKPGRGSVFSFTLPLGPGTAARPRA